MCDFEYQRWENSRRNALSVRIDIKEHRIPIEGYKGSEEGSDYEEGNV
jgi:hypothetical protein